MVVEIRLLVVGGQPEASGNDIGRVVVVVVVMKLRKVNNLRVKTERVD